MGFAEDIKKKTEKVKSEINESVNGIAKELFESIVDKTPVETGRFKNNWYVGTNNISTESNESSMDSSGSASYSRINSLSNDKTFLGKDGYVSLSTSVVGYNNQYGDYVFYPYLIEYYGWSKKKRPEGMVRVSLVEIATKYKAI